MGGPHGVWQGILGQGGGGEVGVRPRGVGLGCLGYVGCGVHGRGTWYQGVGVRGPWAAVVTGFLEAGEGSTEGAGMGGHGGVGVWGLRGLAWLQCRGWWVIRVLRWG